MAQIVDAVVEFMPRDWSYERMRIFAERVWKELLGRHFGKVWFKPDVAYKAAKAVHADMVQFDDRKPAGPEYRLPPPVKQTVLFGEEPDFPRFYDRMLREHPDMWPCFRKLLESGRRRYEARYGRMAAE